MKTAPIFAAFIIFCLLMQIQAVSATVYQKNFVLKEECATFDTNIWQTLSLPFIPSNGIWQSGDCCWYSAIWKNSINSSCNYNLTVRGDIYTYGYPTSIYGTLYFGIVNNNVSNELAGQWQNAGDCAYFKVAKNDIRAVVCSDGIENVVYTRDNGYGSWNTYSIIKNDTGYYFYFNSEYVGTYETINFSENITVYIEAYQTACSGYPVEIDYIYFMSEFEDAVASSVACGSSTLIDTLLSLIDSTRIKYVIDNLITLIESVFNEDNLIGLINTAMHIGTTIYEMIDEFMSFV